MLNQEKYKTPDERNNAFNEWCFNRECGSCELKSYNLFDGGAGCRFYWLALEAEEEIEPCPYCGGEVEVQSRGGEKDGRGNVYLSLVRCPHCGYTSSSSSERDSIGGIISAHNRMARAVRAASD